MSLGTQVYVTLPPCVDQQGHRFTIPPATQTAVCQRCGLVRKAGER